MGLALYAWPPSAGPSGFLGRGGQRMRKALVLVSSQISGSLEEA